MNGAPCYAYRTNRALSEGDDNRECYTERASRPRFSVSYPRLFPQRGGLRLLRSFYCISLVNMATNWHLRGDADIHRSEGPQNVRLWPSLVAPVGGGTVAEHVPQRPPYRL